MMPSMTAATMQQYPNVIQRLARSFTLSNKNADPDNWEWEAKSKAVWGPAGKDWQDFRVKWYGTTESQPASLVHLLSLEPLRDLDPSLSSSILVRKSYVKMFDAVWAKAIASEGRKGVILTGQPGTGKSLFQYYLLVRLLQRKQVVLFSPDGTRFYLFCDDSVYTASMSTRDVDLSLPKPKSSTKVFIWSLFDIREKKEPARFLVTHPRFPVQTASPDPSRYHTWDKEQMPLLTALPLWTRDELVEGLQYQREYSSLLDALEEFCRDPKLNTNSSDAIDVFPGARALLMERYSQEGTVPSPKDALEYLLDAAIERFGYAARDVFHAVFDFSGMTSRHEDAFDLNFTELYAAVSALSKNRTASHTVSHRILSIRPVYKGPFERVGWEVDLKSDWVARGLLLALYEAEEGEVRKLISQFRGIPEARGLAGRLLELFAHRSIARVTGGL